MGKFTEYYNRPAMFTLKGDGIPVFEACGVLLIACCRFMLKATQSTGRFGGAPAFTVTPKMLRSIWIILTLPQTNKISDEIT